MDRPEPSFGVLDNRFLAKSVGLLNPKSALAVSQDSSLEETLGLLKKHKVGAVVITDDEGRVCGIFSERDVILRVALEAVTRETPVKTLMTRDPQTISMTSTIAYALQLMSAQGFRHLPIIDEEKFPLGMISVKDIMDFVAKSLASDLGAVGMPR